MKNLLSLVLLVVLVACSPNDQSATKRSPGLHEYSVAFAAVKIRDEKLKQLGLPAFEEPRSFEAQHKLAAYVLAHSEEFSVTTIKGNCLPVVRNNGETHVKLLLDPKQEEKDFETLGLMTKAFGAGVVVRDEDDAQGKAFCHWQCSFMVHLREPVGNSTEHGGGGTIHSSFDSIGEPCVIPLFHGKGVSLWMLGTLSRNTN